MVSTQEENKPYDVNEPLPLRRSIRGWMPSSAQLENLASGKPSPPSPRVGEEKHDDENTTARSSRAAGEESHEALPDMSAYMEECQALVTDIRAGDAPKTFLEAL